MKDKILNIQETIRGIACQLVDSEPLHKLLNNKFPKLAHQVYHIDGLVFGDFHILVTIVEAERYREQYYPVTIGELMEVFESE